MPHFPSGIAGEAAHHGAVGRTLFERRHPAVGGLEFDPESRVVVEGEPVAAERDQRGRRAVPALEIEAVAIDPDGAFAIADAYNDLASRLLEQPGIRRFETTFVKSRVKATLAVPLAD
jgi:hypothetical protein